MNQFHIFYFIATTIWAIVNLYCALRVVRSVERRSVKIGLWIFALLTTLALPTIFATQRMAFSGASYTTFIIVGYLAAGFMMTIFPFLALGHLASGGHALIDKLRGAQKKDKEPVFDPERRQFMAGAVNMGLVGLSGGLTGFGYIEASRTPQIYNIEIPIKNLPAPLHGFKIAQLTDTHIGPTIRREHIEGIVEMTNSAQADIICYTGDMADGFVPDLLDDTAPLQYLKATTGLYWITGNHEYYWDLPGWLERVRQLGFTTLINEHVVIEPNGRKVVVAGITDYTAHRYAADHTSDPGKALSGAPDDRDVTIMLAHQPRSAWAIAGHNVDLVLMGHTHGGQFLPWSLVVPYFHPVHTGRQRYEGSWYYVSRGTGYWGPPIRSGAPPEISLLTLVPA